MALAGFAGYKALTEGFHYLRWHAKLFVLCGVILFVSEFVLVYLVRRSRRKRNEHKILKWLTDLKEQETKLNATASGDGKRILLVVNAIAVPKRRRRMV